MTAPHLADVIDEQPLKQSLALNRSRFSFFPSFQKSFINVHKACSNISRSKRINKWWGKTQHFTCASLKCLHVIYNFLLWPSHRHSAGVKQRWVGWGGGRRGSWQIYLSRPFNPYMAFQVEDILHAIIFGVSFVTSILWSAVKNSNSTKINLEWLKYCNHFCFCFNTYFNGIETGAPVKEIPCRIFPIGPACKKSRSIFGCPLFGAKGNAKFPPFYASSFQSLSSQKGGYSSDICIYGNLTDFNSSLIWCFNLHSARQLVMLFAAQFQLVFGSTTFICIISQKKIGSNFKCYFFIISNCKIIHVCMKMIRTPWCQSLCSSQATGILYLLL